MCFFKFPSKTSNFYQTYVISIKTHGYEWLEGTAFWESPTLEVTNTEGNKQAFKEFKEGKEKQRHGV